MTTKNNTNGSLKIRPILAWAIVTYLLGLGFGVGVAINRLEWVREEVNDLRKTVVDNTLSKRESDLIHSKLEEEYQGLREDFRELKRNVPVRTVYVTRTVVKAAKRREEPAQSTQPPIYGRD